MWQVHKRLTIDSNDDPLGPSRIMQKCKIMSLGTSQQDTRNFFFFFKENALAWVRGFFISNRCSRT